MVSWRYSGSQVVRECLDVRLMNVSLSETLKGIIQLQICHIVNFAYRHKVSVVLTTGQNISMVLSPVTVDVVVVVVAGTRKLGEYFC